MNIIRNECLKLNLFRTIYEASLIITITRHLTVLLDMKHPLFLTRICIQLNYECPGNGDMPLEQIENSKVLLNDLRFLTSDRQ